MNLYDNIKEDILDKIKNGTYPVGETIPSELELAESYGVSRATACRACRRVLHRKVSRRQQLL